MQDGNPAAGLAAASFIWLEILRGLQHWGQASFTRLGLNLATPVASLCHPTANSIDFRQPDSCLLCIDVTPWGGARYDDVKYVGPL